MSISCCVINECITKADGCMRIKMIFRFHFFHAHRRGLNAKVQTRHFPTSFGCKEAQTLNTNIVDESSSNSQTEYQIIKEILKVQT